MLIILAAIVIAGVLVAPVVLRGSGGSSSHCETRVRFRQHSYERQSGGGTQGAAIGVGVLTGCGRPPANVNVRSLVGIAPARAIAIEGDSARFVIIPSG